MCNTCKVGHNDALIYNLHEEFGGFLTFVGIHLIIDFIFLTYLMHCFIFCVVVFV